MSLKRTDEITFDIGDAVFFRLEGQDGWWYTALDPDPFPVTHLYLSAALDQIDALRKDATVLTNTVDFLTREMDRQRHLKSEALDKIQAFLDGLR